MAAQPGLCRTRSETPTTGFLTTRLIWLKPLNDGKKLRRNRRHLKQTGVEFPVVEPDVTLGHFWTPLSPQLTGYQQSINNQQSIGRVLSDIQSLVQQLTNRHEAASKSRSTLSSPGERMRSRRAVKIPSTVGDYVLDGKVNMVYEHSGEVFV